MRGGACSSGSLRRGGKCGRSKLWSIKPLVRVKEEEGQFKERSVRYQGTESVERKKLDIDLETGRWYTKDKRVSLTQNRRRGGAY